MSGFPVIQSLRGIGPGALENVNQDFVCATCHVEHQGADFALTKMSSQRCQACHVNPFPRFSLGHPEFSAYPYQRRTRIAFNHDSHQGRHFVEKNHPFTCVGCHTLDPLGKQMLSGSFETTCAGGDCHGEQVADSGASPRFEGVAFIALPAIDVDTLSERNIPIGGWLETPDDGGELTPFMKLLLLGDDRYPEAADDLEKVSKLELSDLTEASDADMKVVWRLVWGVKRLLYELIGQGHSILQKRLVRALGTPLDHRDAASLAGQLPIDLVKTAQQKWLPRLMDEVPKRGEGGAMPADEVLRTTVGSQNFREEEETEVVESAVGGETDTVGEPRKWVSAGGWYRKTGDFSLRYRPTGHADPFLRAWLEVTGRSHGIPQAAELFATLSKPTSPGLCSKCHSVDAASEGKRRVNWSGVKPIPLERQFTTFAHTPHLARLTEQQTGDPNGTCQTCHTSNSQFSGNAFQQAFEQTDPTVFISNFESLTKRQCQTCHTQQRAGEDCLTCHNYHRQSGGEW